MHKKLQGLVVKDGALQIFKDLLESSTVLLHCGLRVENSFWAEPNRHFKLSHILQIAEDSIELLLRVKEQFDDLGAPIPEYHEQKLIVLSMPESFEPILLFDCFHLYPLLVEHDQLVVVLRLDHFLHFGFFDVIFKSIIICKYLLLQFYHEILDGCQQPL